jgi:NitT/TauT family transport system substrate-binding protein
MKMKWSEKKQVALLLGLMVLGSAMPGSAQQERPKLHLEIAPMTMVRMPSWVALSEGIYQKNGLDVDQCFPMATADEVRALGVQPPAEYICSGTQTGIAPITLGGLLPTFIGQVRNPQGTRRITILTTQNVTSWPIIARKDISSPQQLKGKRIGVLNFTDIHGFMAMIFSEAMGWNPRTDLTFVEGMMGPPLFKAFENGQMDAIVAIDSAQWLASKAGYKPVVDMMDWKVPMASGSVNVEVGWLRDNRETARRLVKSLVEARAVMERDRGSFNRALAKYFNITDPQLQAFIYSELESLPRKPYPSVDGIRRAMKLYDSFIPDMRKFRPEEFVDDSFVRELDESGYIDNLYK